MQGLQRENKVQLLSSTREEAKWLPFTYLFLSIYENNSCHNLFAKMVDFLLKLGFVTHCQARLDLDVYTCAKFETIISLEVTE